MSYVNIAVPVALQRYVDVPPLAARQREIALALASFGKARVVLLSCEANLGLLPQAETVAQKLKAFAQPLLDARLEVEQVVLSGDPRETLALAINARGCDLALVGSHSKRSVVDVQIGTTATALLKHLTCPVLIVRPTRDDEEKARALQVPHYPPVFTYV